MSSFIVEVDDANGRQGVLDIGGGHVMTPAYVPSDEVSRVSESRPGIERRNSLCECDLWVSRADLDRMRTHPEEKQDMEASVRAKMDDMQSSAKLLHFNFFTDVEGLEKESLANLLGLQYRMGADVIEIPHGFCSTRSYEQAVQSALEWQRRTDTGVSLMGIARTADDLSMLHRYLPDLGGVGIDCRRFEKPLLYQIRRTLKPEDVWVHAFSAPLQYHEVENRGTLGILINWFGVDTVNTIALSDHVRRYFAGSMARMGESEWGRCMRNIRYFAPADYSAFTYGALEEAYGRECRMSRFCDCPVCRNLTLGDALDSHLELYRMNHFHRAFAYDEECRKYQQAIKMNDTDRFLDKRTYAAEIIRRSSGVLVSTPVKPFHHTVPGGAGQVLSSPVPVHRVVM